MENRPCRVEYKDFNQGKSEHHRKMTAVAMVAMSHHMFPSERPQWARNAPLDYNNPARPRGDADRIALPSIRQAFPELNQPVTSQDSAVRTSNSANSPTAQVPGLVTPEYVHSPSSNKRRRVSSSDTEEQERASRVPRLYNSSPKRSTERVMPRPMSPCAAPRVILPEQWRPSRTSPILPPRGVPTMQAPAAMEPVEHVEARPTLPSFPTSIMERRPAPVARGRGHSSDDYFHEAPRPMYMHHPDPRLESGPAFRHGPYTYPYHHPSRQQSLSMNALHHLDRSPFTAVSYGPYSDYMRFGDMGMGMNGDNKQRKRRGNLPKETTDKLRAWFLKHLHHPYPTEDEKQELMRQTGLQMNQISNWFINARRRQLPAMISNARAESDAMSSGRGSESKVLPSTERGEYEDGKNRRSPPSSDEGDGAFDDDLGRLPHHLKRGDSY